jgi:hypothetical protein
MKQRTWVLTAIASVVFVSTSVAQVQVGEGTLEAVPVDFELVSDGSRAVVRASRTADKTDVISIWETSGGTQIAGTSPLGTFCSGAKLSWPSTWPSDAVRVVGTKGVLIGNFLTPTGWQTLIDVVEAGGATPDCVPGGNFAEPSPAPSGFGAFDEAGEAHDLDITPDGKYAVINSRNWVFVVDLSATPPTLALAKNTGLSRPSWALLPVDVAAAVDSVAVTNERAIVVQAAFDHVVGFYPIIQLIDLTGPTPVATQIDMKPIILGLNPTKTDFDPHDVAITPRGPVDALDELAVVTYDYAVSLFDLASMTHVLTILNENIERRYDFQVDSVEVTWDRAVVIGGKANLFPPSWWVQVYSLRTSATPPAPGLSLVWSFNADGRSPHDLALHRGADAAVINLGAKFGSSNVVVSNISSATPTQTTIPSLGNPYRDWTNFPAGRVSRVSDSALTATVDVGGVTKNYGVTIGGSPAAPWSGTIDIVDLSASPPGPVVSLSAGDPMDNTMPTDLDFSSIKKKVFVRCEALPHEPPLAT